MFSIVTTEDSKLMLDDDHVTRVIRRIRSRPIRASVVIVNSSDHRKVVRSARRCRSVFHHEQ